MPCLLSLSLSSYIFCSLYRQCNAQLRTLQSRSICVQYKKKEGKIDYTGDSNTTNDETSKRRIRREKKKWQHHACQRWNADDFAWKLRRMRDKTSQRNIYMSSWCCCHLFNLIFLHFSFSSFRFNGDDWQSIISFSKRPQTYLIVRFFLILKLLFSNSTIVSDIFIQKKKNYMASIARYKVSYIFSI
jgi:hypothetical protein